MLLPEHLSPTDFLADHWQKKPLYIKGDPCAQPPLLNRDELGWLATQPDVESRLVFTEGNENSRKYRLEYGPFSDSYLRQLPAENWTLLVQDVDKHLPDFIAWFDEVGFLPRWRCDDLMVSFAAPGGSVGPHRDNYDVFLCQGEGVRHWQINTDAELPNDETATELSLLQPFAAILTQDCTPGDVLYLPPQVAHWGIAQTPCTTYSIGMRAPTRAELTATMERLSISDGKTEPVGRDEANTFYTDADLATEEVDGRRISARAVQRLYEQHLVAPDCSKYQAAAVLGSTLTDPKAWLDPEKPTGAEINSALELVRQGKLALCKHGMANMCWYSDNATSIVSVNGESRPASGICEAFFQQFCTAGFATSSANAVLTDTQEGAEFLEWLAKQAAFDLEHVLE